MITGIVGHEAAKFDAISEAVARAHIRIILNNASELISGGCHLGGIDIWAEEEADRLEIPKKIFRPKVLAWDGYKARNIKIAEASDVVHCIVVKSLPSTYKGMRFKDCYHCHTNTHIKSGGCWTAKYAIKLGKEAFWHEVEN